MITQRSLSLVATLLFLLAGQWIGQALYGQQHYKFTYDYTFQRDSTNLEGSKHTITCYLYYDALLGTKFIGEASELKDSVILLKETHNLSESELISALLSVPKSYSYNKIIYKKCGESSVLVREYLNNGYFQYSEELKFDWELINEYEHISGYKCQKAVCSFEGREFVAWFAPQIPVSEGPYKFSGLPGLILKVDGDDGQFVFLLEGIQTLEDPPNVLVRSSKKYIETEKSKFIRARHAHFNNYLESANNSGGGRIISTTIDYNAIGKSKNNFIDKK